MAAVGIIIGVVDIELLDISVMRPAAAPPPLGFVLLLDVVRRGWLLKRWHSVLGTWAGNRRGHVRGV